MLFFKFRFRFRIIFRKPKNVQTNRGVNIDQSEMCYISMDSSQRVRPTNGKLFFNFLNKNNSGVGLMHARRGEVFVLISTSSI